MKKRDLKVGMRVRIKSWEDMLKGGFIRGGNIEFPSNGPCFAETMKHLCGRIAVVTRIRNNFIDLEFENKEGRTDWTYTPQMLELVEDENVNEEVRYFELVSDFTGVGGKGDIGELIHEEKGSGQPYLLYNEIRN